MNRRSRLLIACLPLFALLPAGCPRSGGCPPTPTADPPPLDTPLFVGSGDPYEAGALAVRTLDLARCEEGAPTPLRVHAPRDPGDYPVVVFQHGFLARGSDYDGLLVHLASHGFVVVAPQMYEPGPLALFGQPTAAAEADLARSVIEWLPGRLSRLTGVQARTDRLGLAGHSRGGKVAWLMFSADPALAQSIAGVDPVDGTGGPLGGQARVVQGAFRYSAASLVIGTEMGGDCAPAGDNYVQFFDACPAPAWRVVLPGAGHADMLDDEPGLGNAATAVCERGGDRDGARTTATGLLAAFFRAELQGDSAARAYLTAATAPRPILVERK